uniref:Uncharacterized protein n=1 Tax=uncultured Thiotrichaceae bacterium TaxID=298394 RepID=A0A6S6UMH6_9GAMM|nr:MAG: Unknown protein [uncultured Thiotrichaceae bacterium]
MKKIIPVLLISGLLSTPAFADKGNVAFDQHFKVTNKSGSKIEFSLQKGRYVHNKRTKKIANKKSDRIKYNNLKEEVKVGCGPSGCDNAYFERTFDVSIKKASNPGYPTTCSITVNYKSNKARNKVIKRWGSSLFGGNTCGSSIVASNFDGKTTDIKITGTNW